MKIERAKNASRNIIFGVILKGYQTVIPFLMRTIIIYFMGVQYLGLNSLFISILQVLNLAELGVGSAMVYSMYKPIAKDNEAQICALMRLYRKYYSIIGWIIAIVGCILTPLIPLLIKSDLPADLNIYVLYLLNLGVTVLSYWLFAYRNALFIAHQRVDVTSKITFITTTIQYGIQVLVIIFLKDYYIYVMVALLSQILNNFFIAMVAHKMYPRYSPVGKLDSHEVKNINGHIKDLFTSKLGGVILNSSDTVVISSCLGLTALAIYQNYFFILTSIIGIITIVFNSCMAGIGNSIIVETKEKNLKDLEIFSFLITWIAGWCVCCLLCLYQPFMKIWVGENLMLPFTMVVCFCVYYYIYEINQLLNIYKDAAGIWHSDRFRPLVTASSNLLLNLIMIQVWGLYGVILSTVFSMICIGIPWLLHNLFTTIFEKKDMKAYVLKTIQNSVIVLIACMITYLITNFVSISDFADLIIKAICCCIIPNALFYIIFRKTSQFNECVLLIRKILKR